MATTYEIIDSGGFSEIAMKEAGISLKFWTFPKTVSIEVANGYLSIYLGRKLIIPKIPREFITIPASTDDEDLSNKLGFMTEKAGSSGVNIYNTDGSLTSNRTLTEDGFDFTADREELINIGGNDYGPVTTYYKSYIGQVFPDAEPVNALVRSMGLMDASGDVEIGVYGNQYYESAGFMKARFFASPTITRESYLKHKGGSVSWEVWTRDTGIPPEYVRNFALSFGGNTFEMYLDEQAITWTPFAFSMNFSNVQLNLTAGSRFLLYKNSDPIKNDVVVLEIPIAETISGVAPVVIYTTAVLNDQYLQIEFVGVYFQVGVSGNGTIHSIKGGGGRNGAGALQMTTSSEEIEIVGAVTLASGAVVASTNNIELRFNPNSVGDTKVSGILKITRATIPA